jgi:hypothetical protein
MSDEAYQAVSPAEIRACARADFDRGLPITAHCMNPGSTAIFDYEEEWKRCAQQVQLAKAVTKRVDARQVQP